MDLGAFQGKSNLGLDAQMALKADALKGVKKPSAAEKIVLKVCKWEGGGMWGSEGSGAKGRLSLHHR